MTGPREPRDVGRRLLGPHVVGQRVVVRRLLRGETGPSGGPAMTDVLGVCTEWGDGRCVVHPEGGEPVTIRTSDIVSGKPVPPRPSPRHPSRRSQSDLPRDHRASPLEAQTRALALWPDLQTRPVGRWLLRHSPTAPNRRANSVLAMAPSGVEDDLEQVVDYYARTTGRPVAAVLPGSAEEERFASHGWDRESADADTVFQLAGVAQVRRRLASRALPGSEAAELVEDGQHVTVRVGDRASGVAAYDRDWVGVRAVHVRPADRGQGWARLVMAALLDWAAERGATTAYLQVLGDNEPALALYGGLGFSTHHTYRYLAPRH